VLASRVICEPLHLFMLCSPNEGAAAVVLTRADRVAAPGVPPIALAGAVLRSHLPGSVLSESTPLSGLTDDSVPAPTTLAARAAFEEAGLCYPGGSAELLVSGATALGGRLPVNPSGGLLSKGEPLGASALGQVVELVRQLRGECGPRQVEGARVALSHTVGRGANAGAVILTR